MVGEMVLMVLSIRNVRDVYTFGDDMEKMIQPKMLYCKKCEAFSKPSHSLVCMDCGQTLTTCWWALLHKIDNTKQHCKECENRFWCWTNTLDGSSRIPSFTQARIANNSYFKNR